LADLSATLAELEVEILSAHEEQEREKSDA
jgi:hypothetical protein